MRFRTSGVALLTAALALSTTQVTARAAPPPRASWTVTAPSATGIAAVVELDRTTGVPTLSVQRRGRVLLSPAPVGLRTAEADLSTGLRLVGQSRRTISERYTTTTGKQRERTVLAAETRFSFATAAGARLDLLVRAAEDGVAYRYALPAAATVLAETSAFTLPADSTAWLLPYSVNYENRRVRTTAAAADTATDDFAYPALFQVGEDHVLLTESAVDGRYSGSRLLHTTGSGTYRVALADASVRSDGPLETPWRTVIAGSLATVTESTMVDDLAPPATFTDTSWIVPGKVAWSWLSEHDSPRDFERQKDYVDFAARNGWPYVLVDEGWSDTWVPELTRYARARGVDVLLWYHWTRLDTPGERDAELTKIVGWGVKGVKVDFMDSDSRERYRWYDEILADTARLRLMINFHGSTIPHGIARTWPHVMTMEAIHGAEQLPQPDNDTVHPFTRNVVGSMDFTPVSLEVGPKTSSVAHEIALPVAYESGWTHFADMPEAYEKYPNALRFLDQVPTVWDETRLVSGDVSGTAVLARRAGERWFVGGLSSGDARTLSAPLSFLGGGRWLVELVRDPESGVRGDVRRTSSVETSRSTLSVGVPRHGGFAAVACPARPGRQTCDEPVQRVAETSLTITPRSADVERGGRRRCDRRVLGDLGQDRARRRAGAHGPRRLDGDRRAGDRSAAGAGRDAAGHVDRDGARRRALRHDRGAGGGGLPRSGDAGGTAGRARRGRPGRLRAAQRTGPRRRSAVRVGGQRLRTRGARQVEQRRDQRRRQPAHDRGRDLRQGSGHARALAGDAAAGRALHAVHRGGGPGRRDDVAGLGGVPGGRRRRGAARHRRPAGRHGRGAAGRGPDRGRVADAAGDRRW
jgi:hypothetical protein